MLDATAVRVRTGPLLARVRPFWIEPWTPLGLLALLQWALVLGLALRVERNGWLFYQGGDQTFLYSSAVVVGHGHLPEASVGYLWPIVLAPITWVAGPNFIAGLPGILLLQVLVLLPLGLLAIYGAASRIGGRLVGYLAAVVWVLAPHLTTSLFVARYHEKWFDLTLPQTLGLTGMGDFPSMVLLTVAAYFVLRLLDEGSDVDAVLAGVVTGLAIGLKPANALFLGGVILALPLARRWRGGLVYGLALAPAFLTLALWKYRGLGALPIFSASPAIREAAAATLPTMPLAGIGGHYANFDWHRYRETIDSLREVFWSRRLLEFIPLAGLIGAARASWAKAAFLGGWFFAFFVVKTTRGTIDAADWWRLMTPSWPAFLLLMCSLALLVPGVGGKLRERRPPEPGPARRWSRPLLVVLGVLTVVPLLLVVALPVQRAETAARIEAVDIPGQPPATPDLMDSLDPSIELEAVRRGDRVVLRWHGGDPGRAAVFYHVLRARTVEPRPPAFSGIYGTAVDGLRCTSSGAPHCATWMTDLGSTREQAFVDKPGPGKWSYRVEVAGNFKDDLAGGDPLTYSKAARVTVP